MISRIQIRAEGDTARDVERELRWAAASIAQGFGLEADLVDQVIEGTPGARFAGRVTLTVTSQPTKREAVLDVHGIRYSPPVDAVAREAGSTRGKVTT